MCCLFFNVSFYVTFHFTLTDTFQHFLKDRPGADEFPELLLAWESVHLTSFLKDCFAGWSTLDRPLFSFSTLNISFHSLLACEISAEKSTDKIMGFPCKLQALFFLLLLRFSLGFFFTYLLYAICLGENFCKLILSDGLWASWTWMFNSLPIWDVLSIISEKAMAPHSSTLAWKILWTEEPGRLQSVRSLRVEHDWATSLSLFTLMHWRRKWQLTPVFLPGESQGRGSLVGCCLWGRTESDMTEAT